MIIILRRVILVVFILSLGIPWGRPKPAQAAAGLSPAFEARSPGSILYPQGCSTKLAAYTPAQVRQLALHSPSASLVLQPGQAVKLVGGTGPFSTDAVMVYVYAPEGLRRQFCVYYSISTTSNGQGTYALAKTTLDTAISNSPFKDRSIDSTCPLMRARQSKSISAFITMGRAE